MFKSFQSFFASFSSHSIGLISLIFVISFWLIASILTKDILVEYNKPALLTFISVTSMQVYFIFLWAKDPLFEYLESKYEYENIEISSTKSFSTIIAENDEDYITLIEVKCFFYF